MKFMTVEIWTDITCPWCGLGNHQLNLALEKFKHGKQVAVVHRSFQLDPSTPEGETWSTREFLQRKGLPEAQIEAMVGRIEAMAAAQGLSPYVVLDNRVGNTSRAHELAAWARESGKGAQIWGKLYAAYFGEVRSVFDVDSLVAIAGEVGLDTDAAREVLTSRRYRNAVLADGAEAQQLGSTGVPFIVLDRSFAVSGAQPVEALVNALEQVWGNRTPLAELAGASDDAVCGPDGCLVPQTPDSRSAATKKSIIGPSSSQSGQPHVTKLTLISAPTCPFVQRAVIALKEKQVDFDVVYVDLADKPDWFLALSPLGKVPLLKVERDGFEPAIVFESAVILEYLEETTSGDKLHPQDALERARHRSWIEFGSQVLIDLYRLTTAKDEAALDAASAAVRDKFARLEPTLVGPLFGGERFSNVDAAFAPVFRQIDAIETIVPTGLLDGLPRLGAWRWTLAARPSVKTAVPDDFVQQYLGHLCKNVSLLLKPASSDVH